MKKSRVCFRSEDLDNFRIRGKVIILILEKVQVDQFLSLWTQFSLFDFLKARILKKLCVVSDIKSKNIILAGYSSYNT